MRFGANGPFPFEMSIPINSIRKTESARKTSAFNAHFSIHVVFSFESISKIQINYFYNHINAFWK